MSAERRAGWLARFSGLRVRTTAIATLVVGLALAAGGAGLLWAIQGALTESVRATAESRARDLGVLAERGALPDRLPTRGEALMAQVFDVDGRTLAASADLIGDAPISDLAVAPGELVEMRVDWPEAEDEDEDEEQETGDGDDLEPAWLVALGVETPSGPATVLVLAPLHGVDETTELLTSLLGAALPLLLLATALLVWQLVGRTLRPVEAIRARAEAITAEDLREAVAVPVPEARDEVRSLALTLNDLLARLRDASLARRRFVADAAHELRSPIAAMRTMLEVARDYPDTVDMAELVPDLLREDLRLERLADDLLTLARHDERALAAHRVPLDPTDLLREEVVAARTHHGLQVSLDEQRVSPIDADGHALRRLLRNLLDNAARHAEAQVWVSVAVAGVDRANVGQGLEMPILILRVSDDGPGIAPADRERVFERFVRLDDARGRGTGGAGLGLPVARAVAEAHGGTLRIVAPEHGGATFELRLPLASAHEELSLH